MALRWWVSVASLIPTTSASSRWLAGLLVFIASNTSHTGSEPPAAASASSNARPTVLAVWVSSWPTGCCAGRMSAG
jgi:hypothetical protein